MNATTILLSTMAANRLSPRGGTAAGPIQGIPGNLPPIRLNEDGGSQSPSHSESSRSSLTPFEQQLFTLCNPETTRPLDLSNTSEEEILIDWQTVAMIASGAIPVETQMMGAETITSTAPIGLIVTAAEQALLTTTGENPVQEMVGTPDGKSNVQSALRAETSVVMQSGMAVGITVPDMGNREPNTNSANAITPQTAAVAATIAPAALILKAQNDENLTKTTAQPSSGHTPVIENSLFSASPTGNTPSQMNGQMTTGAPSAAEPQTMDANRLLEQFDQLVLRTLKTDNKTLRVELQPAAMGRMVLQCRQTDSGLSIQLDVQNNDVRSLLTNEEHNLRNALQNKGIQVGQFSVSSQTRQDSASGNPSDRQQHHIPQPEQNMNFTNTTPPRKPVAAARHYRQRYSRWIA